MIPEFPQFKSLELSDKEEIEKITQKYPPYSDFNFVSMWSWDIKGEMRISILNGNLVVRFTDYLTGKPFYSFLGDNKVDETVEALLQFSKKEGLKLILNLIPEVAVNTLNKLEYTIVSDKNSHDYIYLISDLANMDKWSQNTSGKKIRKFLKMHPNYTIKISSAEDILQEEYKEMFERWAKNKNIIDYLELNEYKAFDKMLQIKDKNIKIVSLYVENVLIGFSVYEKLSNGFAMSHFAKADTEVYSAAYDVLNWEEAKILKKQGLAYYNWEQDLGILGLRNSKLKYKPIFFLKQFILSHSLLVSK